MSWDDGTKIVAECLRERGVDADAMQDGEKIRITAPRTGFGFFIGVNRGMLYVQESLFLPAQPKFSR